MPVAEIRKALSIIRSKWRGSGPLARLWLGEKLWEDMSIEEFCFRFVLSQHMKRHDKSAARRDAAVLCTGDHTHTHTHAHAATQDTPTTTTDQLWASKIVTLTGDDASAVVTKYVLTSTKQTNHRR